MRTARASEAAEAEAEAEEEDAAAAELRSAAAATRALQADRKRGRGLAVEGGGTSVGADPAAAGGAAAAASREAGKAAKEEAAQHGGLALAGAFAGATGVAPETAEERRAQAYVEAELARRRGGGGGEAEGAGAEEASLWQPPAALDTPAHFEPESADHWTTGIQEVALPVEHKLRNIEETEKAKAALLQRQRQGGGAKRAAPVASDDAVAKRFRSRELARFRR